MSNDWLLLIVLDGDCFIGEKGLVGGRWGEFGSPNLSRIVVIKLVSLSTDVGSVVEWGRVPIIHLLTMFTNRQMPLRFSPGIQNENISP